MLIFSCALHVVASICGIIIIWIYGAPRGKQLRDTLILFGKIVLSLVWLAFAVDASIRDIVIHNLVPCSYAPEYMCFPDWAPQWVRH